MGADAKCCSTSEPAMRPKNLDGMSDGDSIDLDDGHGKIRMEGGRKEFVPPAGCNSEGNSISRLDLENDQDSADEITVDFCDTAVKECPVESIKAKATLKGKF